MKYKDTWFETKTYPAKRIVMKILCTKVLIDFVKSDQLFLEEAMIIDFLQREFLIDSNQMQNTKLYLDLCLFDILKFQRLFAFLFLCFKAYIESENLLDSKLFYRSILPVFPDNELHNLLSLFFGEQKSTQMIRQFKLEVQQVLMPQRILHEACDSQEIFLVYG